MISTMCGVIYGVIASGKPCTRSHALTRLHAMKLEVMQTVKVPHVVNIIDLASTLTTAVQGTILE